MPNKTGYLPLAHILEFATETFLILVGGRIGYSSPHTITDLSMGIAPGTPGDATLLRPTLMATVPLVCDRIRKAIYARLNSKGLLAVRLFEYIIDYKTFWTSKGKFSCPSNKKQTNKTNPNKRLFTCCDACRQKVTRKAVTRECPLRRIMELLRLAISPRR